MNKKLFKTFAFASLTLCPLMISGCKEKKCEVQKEQFTIEKKINPTLENEGIIIKKCPECGEIEYTILPNLYDISYTKTFVRPSFSEQNEFVPGYYSYTSSEYGSYVLPYDFNRAFYIFEDTVNNETEFGSLYKESVTYYNFYEDGRAEISTQTTQENQNYFTTCTQNEDGSFTFKFNEEVIDTLFIYTDNTFSTTLEDGKVLASLEYGENVFSNFGIDKNNTILTYLSLNVSPEGEGSLTKITTSYGMEVNSSYFYEFVDEDEICLVQTKRFNDRSEIISYNYLTLSYETGNVAKRASCLNYVLEYLNETPYKIQNVNETPTPSSYGENVSLSYNLYDNTFVLTIDSQTHTISADKIQLNQSVEYLSSNKLSYNYIVNITCTDEDYPFSGKIILGQ